MPNMPARRRSAPTVRFNSFEIFATGVRAFECAFKARKSSLVQGRIMRREAFAGTDFFVVVFLAVAFFANFNPPIVRPIYILAYSLYQLSEAAVLGAASR